MCCPFTCDSYFNSTCRSSIYIDKSTDLNIRVLSEIKCRSTCTFIIVTRPMTYRIYLVWPNAKVLRVRLFWRPIRSRGDSIKCTNVMNSYFLIWKLLEVFPRLYV